MLVLSPDSLLPNLAPAAVTSLPHSGSVRRTPSFVDSTPGGRKLQKAAAEFESMLLSNLWKSMKSSFASGDEESMDPAHDALADMGIQAMSSAVAKTGGLGIGRLILKHLEPMLAESAKGERIQPDKASAFPADTFLEVRQAWRRD
jgi:Rod binding domain-containing protein